jgi:hypothetical protein
MEKNNLRLRSTSAVRILAIAMLKLRDVKKSSEEMGAVRYWRGTIDLKGIQIEDSVTDERVIHPYT